MSPEQGRHIFEQLFLHSGFDDVLSFLDERTSLLQELRMLVRLPWMPFVSAFLRPQPPWSPALPQPTR
jgi:hypothetical protein